MWPGARIAEPTGPLRVIDARGFQVLVAVARRVLTMDDADHVAIAHSIDLGLLMTPREAQADFNDLLGLFENALPGLLLDGRAAPFTRLSAAAQDRVLLRWRDSRLVLRRGGYHALRRLCLAGYYADARSWPGVRYQGPPVTAGFHHDDSRAGTPGWTGGGEADQGGGAP